MTICKAGICRQYAGQVCGVELHLAGLQSHQAALILSGIDPLKILQDLCLQILCSHTSASTEASGHGIVYIPKEIDPTPVRCQVNSVRKCKTLESGHLPALWADEEGKSASGVPMLRHAHSVKRLPGTGESLCQE